MTATIELVVTAAWPRGVCQRGHLMTRDNVVTNRGGGRRCKSCKALVRHAGRVAPVGPQPTEAELLAETIDAVRHRPRTSQWRVRAACHSVDPELFEEASPGEALAVGGRPERLGRIQEAMKVCRSCPVRSECDATALSATDYPPTGVVGSRYYGAKAGKAQVRRAEIAAVVVAQGGVS